MWSGQAVEAFDGAAGEVADAATMLRDSVDRAAAVVTAWARMLEGFHEDGLVWRDAAREADDDVAIASSGVAAMRRHEADQGWRGQRGGEVAPWTGPDWRDELSDARHRRRVAQERFDDVVAAHDVRARRVGQELAEAVGEVDISAELGAWSAGMVSTTGVLRSDGIEFVRTPSGLVVNTPESWRVEAYRQAGVSRSGFDPELGLEGLDGAPASLWEFYGDLYEANPDQFQWAGMANLAGIKVHAGIEDLVQVRKLVEAGTYTPVEAIEQVLGVELSRLDEYAFETVLMGPLALADVSADEFVAEARWTETHLLKMQQAIFDDLAWQHLAYQHGGLPALRAIAAEDPDEVKRAHLTGWQMVEAHKSEDALIKFARHEQFGILQNFYDEMLARKPRGL